MPWVDMADAPAGIGGYCQPVVCPNGDTYIVGEYIYKWTDPTWSRQGTFDEQFHADENPGSPSADHLVWGACAPDNDTLVFCRNDIGSSDFRAIIYSISGDSYNEYNSGESVISKQPQAVLHSDGDKLIMVWGQNSPASYWIVFDFSGAPAWGSKSVIRNNPSDYIQWSAGGTVHGALYVLGAPGSEEVYLWDYYAYPTTALWKLNAGVNDWDFVYAKSYYDDVGSGYTNRCACYSDRGLHPVQGDGLGVLVLDTLNRNRPSGEAAGEPRWHGSKGGPAAYRWIQYQGAGTQATVQSWESGPDPVDFEGNVSGATVETTWTWGDKEGWDQETYQVRLYDGVAIDYDSGEVSSTNEFHNFTGCADGTYTPKLRVKNEDGEYSDWIVADDVVVATGGGGADVTPPTVDITTPADAATVSGDVTVSADLTDETGLAAAELWIDGVKIDEDLTMTGLSDTVTFTWGSAGWTNGSHVVRVRALDTSENSATHDHTVTTNNAYSDAQRTLITTLEQLPGLTGHVDVAKRLHEALRWDPPTNDPYQDYLCWVGCRATVTPGDESDDLADFTTVAAPGVQTHEPPSAGDYFQWAIQADPKMYVQALTLTGCTEFLGMAPGATIADMLFLGGATDKLFTWDGATLTDAFTIPAIGATDPVAVAWVDGMAMIAQGRVIRLVDLDSGDIEADVEIDPGSLTSSWVVADIVREADDAALVSLALDSAPDEGAVYRFTYGDITEVGTFAAVMANKLLVVSGAAYVGGAGVLYDVTDMATPVYDTGEASITKLAAAGAELVAGTGTAAKLFTSTPSWGQRLDLPGAAITGAVEVWDALYVAGTQADVWRRDPVSGNWALVIEPDLDSIAGLGMYSFSDGDALLIGGVSAGVAKVLIYRITPDDPDRVLSGPNPPCCSFGVTESERTS